MSAARPVARKVLVANRGEIACRIFAALREEGLSSIAIASEADRRARHVREADEAVVVGGAAAADSYLAIDKICRVAKERGAWGVHPGYGFLAENARFAAAVEAAGLVFLGPRPETIALLGDKRAARSLAVRAGAPIVPGWEGAAHDIAAATQAAHDLGWPVLVKAALGGGGKGMTKAANAGELAQALESAARVASAAFGDAAVYLEKWIESPRHVEVQIFGDGEGNVVHCYERECSLQRRHQKVVEEAPSPSLDSQTREKLTAAAVAIGREANYRSAGTCEFLVDARRAFYFLEVNARIQVEHPVTECVTGIDLVRAQIRLAHEGRMTLRQEEIQMRGAAVEARLYAEDPAHGFIPQAGEVVRFDAPRGPGLRVDAGVETGDAVSTHYDPMIAKVVAFAEDRPTALRRLSRALDTTCWHGPRTNLDFLQWLVRHPAVLEGRMDTGMVERELIPEWEKEREAARAERSALFAAAAALADLHGLAPASRSGSGGGAAREGNGAGVRTSATTPFDTLERWRHPGLSRELARGAS